MNDLIALSGKPRDLCIRALTAAQGIPDIAYDLLMSGVNIPDVPQGAPDMDIDYGDEFEPGEGEEGGAGLG